jgi:hypothetical protein
MALVVVITVRRQAGSHGLGSCGLRPAMSAGLSGLTVNWPAARTPVGGVRGIRLEVRTIIASVWHPRWCGASPIVAPPKDLQVGARRSADATCQQCGDRSPEVRHDLALLAFSAGQDDPSQQRQGLRRAPARRRRPQLSARPISLNPSGAKRRPMTFLSKSGESAMDRVQLGAAELQTRGTRCPIASFFKSEIDFAAQKSHCATQPT